MTTTELAARLIDAGAFPTRADTTTQKIIDEANSEMTKRLIPLFRKMRGNFLGDYVDYTIVASQASYAIPARAITSGIEIIKYIDSAGREVGEVYPIPLKRVGRTRPNGWVVADTTEVLYPTGYHMTADGITLDPVPTSASGSLRVYYARRPGKLVISTAKQLVVSLGGVNSIVLDALTGLGVIVNGTTKIDIMEPNPPYKMRAKDVTITANAAPIITVDLLMAGNPSGLVAGDYVTLAKQSFVPELPEEWHELLLDLTIAKFHRKVGNYLASNEITKQVNDAAALLVSATAPRTQQSNQYLNPLG